jgi:hypothetical protein
LEIINEKLQRVTEPGDFLIMIGEKEQDLIICHRLIKK